MDHKVELVDIRYLRTENLWMYSTGNCDRCNDCDDFSDYVDEEGNRHIVVASITDCVVEVIPVACIALANVDGEPVLGWSVCAKGDQFSYKMAKELAKLRAVSRFEDPKLNNLELDYSELRVFDNRDAYMDAVCTAKELADKLGKGRV